MYLCMYICTLAHTKGVEIYWQIFRHFRNVVSNSLKIAKCDYYTGLILENKNKPKLMWKYLKEMLPGNAKPNPKGLLIDSQIVIDPKCMSNVFNNYFTSIGQDLACQLPPAPPFIPPETLEIPAFTFPSVTSEFVQIKLQNMPENKAVGLDKLPCRLLRAAAPIISEHLAYILNLFLQSGKLISEWKHDKVLPLFKSGPAMETNNYRPIFILPILSKLLKRFVHNSFSEYLEEHNLLSIAQSSFKRLHSTVTSLLHVTDRWLMNLDKGLVTGVVFIDLRKAFDTVDVSILLTKLPSFGITGIEHKRFKSYLSGRSQSVSVDGHLSDPLPVSIDIPQGSQLSQSLVKQICMQMILK